MSLRNVPLGLLSRLVAILIGIAIVGLGMWRGKPSVFDANRYTGEIHGVGCGTMLLVGAAVGMIVFSEVISDLSEALSDQGAPSWLVAGIGWIMLLGVGFMVLFVEVTAY